jgi:hypothetical protein
VVEGIPLLDKKIFASSLKQECVLDLFWINAWMFFLISVPEIKDPYSDDINS